MGGDLRRACRARRCRVDPAVRRALQVDERLRGGEPQGLVVLVALERGARTRPPRGGGADVEQLLAREDPRPHRRYPGARAARAIMRSWSCSRWRASRASEMRRSQNVASSESAWFIRRFAMGTRARD